MFFVTIEVLGMEKRIFILRLRSSGNSLVLPLHHGKARKLETKRNTYYRSLEAK